MGVASLARLAAAVQDCNGNADTAGVTLTFVEPPTAIADTYTHTGSSLTVVDSAQVRGILFNDLNPACPGKPLIATVVNPTTWGVVTLTTDGGFTYVPNPNVQPGECLLLQLSVTHVTYFGGRQHDVCNS